MGLGEYKIPSVCKCNSHGIRPSRAHGTKRNLIFGGNVIEPENRVGGTLPCHGRGMEPKL